MEKLYDSNASDYSTNQLFYEAAEFINVVILISRSEMRRYWHYMFYWTLLKILNSFCPTMVTLIQFESGIVDINNIFYTTYS